MRKRSAKIADRLSPAHTAPAAARYGAGSRIGPWQFLTGGFMVLLLTTACAFLSPDGSEKQDPQRMNAYWNCPSATPWPSATPAYEYVAVTGTPNALGTPGGVEWEE